MIFLTKTLYNLKRKKYSLYKLIKIKKGKLDGEISKRFCVILKFKNHTQVKSVIIMTRESHSPITGKIS